MFSSRRKTPKRVAREEPESRELEDDTGPVVRRPTVAPKTKSKLRISFNPGETVEDEDVPKLSKLVSSTSTLPRFNTDVERPSYSKSYLDELRNSTPSTPRDVTVDNPIDESTLDVAAKFGSPSISIPSAIPSAAEIQEKKERRARLAKEQGQDDFIPLEDYDSDGEFKPQRMQVGSYLQREAEKDTRLVRDDEDFAEGFEQYVDDPGRVTMNKKGLREQARKEREAMREMIEQAEGSEDDESDSEAEQNHAYESAQTHHGMDGLAAHSQQQIEANRPRQPREVTQIPKLAVALGRLREAVQRIELEKVKIERRRAEVRKERTEIKSSQDHIQKSLEDAGEVLKALQLEDRNNTAALPERGLDSMGTETVG